MCLAERISSLGINGAGKSGGQPANPGSHGKLAIKTVHVPVVSVVDASSVCCNRHVTGYGKSGSETNSSSVNAEGVHLIFGLLI